MILSIQPFINVSMIISLIEFAAIVSMIYLAIVAINSVSAAAKKIFAVSKEKELKSILSKEIDPKIRAAFQGMVKRAKKRLSRDEMDRLYVIQRNVLLILEHSKSNRLFDEDLFTVKQIAYDYLPKTVDAYLGLTSEFADTQNISQGKTAKGMFMDQLAILDEHTSKTLIAVNNKNADALRIQNEFLKTKFANHNWLD